MSDVFEACWLVGKYLWGVKGSRGRAGRGLEEGGEGYGGKEDRIPVLLWCCECIKFDRTESYAQHRCTHSCSAEEALKCAKSNIDQNVLAPASSTVHL